MGKNNAKLPNIMELIQAGIDPKTGLPLKLVEGAPSALKRGMKHIFRIIDEQDAINRFKWTIPEGFDLTGQDIERILYYHGKVCFFKLDEKYYLMPFALEGTIDFYGRYNTVHPVPFASGMEYEKGSEKANEDEQNYKDQMALLSALKLRVIYTKTAKDINPDESCVLLYDYCKQRSQDIVARWLINDPLLDVMACTIPYLKTAMIAASGVKGIRVNDADQYQDVTQGAYDVDKHALTGRIWYPLLGTVEFQELTDKSGTKMAEYMETLQSLNNLRRETYGINNSGVFQKSSHMLESEQEMNTNSSSLVMDDGLQLRKHFCEVVKYVFGIDIQVQENQQEQESTEISNGDNPKDKQEGGNE